MTDSDAAVGRCAAWFLAPRPSHPPPDRYCPTRDVFEGRLARLAAAREVAALGPDEAPLLVAVAGEIGSNAFDHNLGLWPDLPGCWFEWLADATGCRVWIADRGRGVRASLRRVLPDLASDQEALEVAFRRVVSGRAPERRGNGLKFVRSVVNGRTGRGLFAASGAGTIALGDRGASLAEKWRAAWNPKGVAGRGLFAVVEWTRHAG